MPNRGEVGERTHVAVVAGWFDAHAAAIGRYAARRVGPVTARDIVAETFKVALEQFDHFDAERGEERAWLYGIATNLLRRHWRTEERRLRTQARSMQADLGPVDPLVSADEHVDARRRYELVVDAVVCLDPEDRDLLILVAWERMSSGGVAAVLGTPSGAVRSRLKRIRAQLACDTRQGEDDE